MNSLSNTSAFPDAVVRAAEPEDYAAIKAIYEQPGAYFGTLQLPFPSKQEWKDRLTAWSTGSRALVACVDDVPVGQIGLIPMHHQRRRHAATIGMGVHDDYAGKGLGQLLMDAVIDLADNWLSYQRLELTVYVDNERAIRLYERCGFVEEGVFRRYAFRAGEYVDALAMARFPDA